MNLDQLDCLPAVAREAIRASLEGRAPAAFEPVPRGAPVFVTLRIDGKLRGCMGALAAQSEDLVQETMARALAAAFDDPRFDKLTLVELDCCHIDVTVLGPLEHATEAELDPVRYGVEMSDDAGRRAVLLPRIDGVETVERQLEIVRRKAGIARGVRVRIRRFETRSLPHS